MCSNGSRGATARLDLGLNLVESTILYGLPAYQAAGQKNGQKGSAKLAELGPGLNYAKIDPEVSSYL